MLGFADNAGIDLGAGREDQYESAARFVDM
jgi:hypothetical protein